MNISIDKRHEALIKRMVESGEYDSPNEVLDAALRLLEKHQQELNALREEIQKGFDGPSLSGEQVMEGLISRAADQPSRD